MNSNNGLLIEFTVRLCGDGSHNSTWIGDTILTDSLCMKPITCVHTLFTVRARDSKAAYYMAHRAWKKQNGKEHIETPMQVVFGFDPDLERRIAMKKNLLSTKEHH